MLIIIFVFQVYQPYQAKLGITNIFQEVRKGILPKCAWEFMFYNDVSGILDPTDCGGLIIYPMPRDLNWQ